jgi:DNA-binding ferritin-like protein
MPDNLSISIGVDSGKARADLELLKQQFRAAQKELRDFTKASVEAGDKVSTAPMIAAGNRVAALDAQLKALNRTTKETSSVMDVLATKSMRRLLTQFDNVGKSAQNIAMVMGGVTGSFAGGFLAASVFKAMSTLIEQLDAVAERIKKIGDEAAKTGQKPIAVQAGQEVAQAVGQPADAASRFMTVVADAAAAAQTAGKELTGGINVMRGSMNAAGDAAKNMGSQMKGGVSVLRGSSPLTMDLSKAYEMLGVSMKNVTGTGDIMLKKQLEVAKAFLAQQKSFNPLQLNELAKALKFESATEALKVLPALIANIQKKIDELNASARGVSPDRIAKQEELKAAKDRVNTWFDELRAAGEDWRTQTAITWNNALADFLEKTLPAWGEGFKKFWPELLADLQSSWDTFNTNLKANFGATAQEMFKGMMDWFGSAIDWMIEKANQLGAAVSAGIRSVTGGAPAGDPSIPAMPSKAAGGMIRGPGSGTSDSILARLSNGEFVMRAAAVSKWGPRFMVALNSLQNPFGYAGGGLVRRFAAGGMVSARTADGVTVNLSFPGGTFALRGDAEIVGGLTREARRAGMLSAGRLAAAIN